MINNDIESKNLNNHLDVISSSESKKSDSTEAVAVPLLQQSSLTTTDIPLLEVNVELIHPLSPKLSLQELKEDEFLKVCQNLIAKKEYEKALEILSSLPVMLSPKLFNLQIKILEETKQWDKMIAQVEQNFSFLKEESISLFTAISALIQADQLEKANELAKKAYNTLKHDPNHLSVMLPFQISLIAFRRHRYSECIKVLEPIVDYLKIPADTKVLLILAECYLNTNQMKKSKLIIDKIRSVDSQSPDLATGFLLARGSFENGDFDTAWNFCEKFLSLIAQINKYNIPLKERADPNKYHDICALSKFVLCLKAEIILKRQDKNYFITALAVCDEILKTSPQFAKALNLKARIIIQQKLELPGVLDLLNFSHKLDKDNPETFFLFGLYHLIIKKDWKNAKSYFNESLRILPKYKLTIIELCKYNLFVLNDLTRAEILAQQVLEANPFCCDGWYYLAEIYLRKCVKESQRDLYSKKFLESIEHGFTLAQKDADRDLFLNLKINFHIDYYSSSRMEMLLNECYELIERYSDQKSTYQHLSQVFSLFTKYKEFVLLLQLTTRAIEKKIYTSFYILDGVTTAFCVYEVRAHAYFNLKQFDKAQLDFNCYWLSKGKIEKITDITINAYLETLENNKDFVTAIQVCEDYILSIQTAELKKLYKIKLRSYQQEVKKQRQEDIQPTQPPVKKPLIDLTPLKMNNQPLPPKILPKTAPKADIKKIKQEVEKFTKEQEATEIARLKELKEVEVKQKQEKAELAKKKQETKVSKNSIKQQEIQQKLQQKNEQKKGKSQSVVEKHPLSAALSQQIPSLSSQTTDDENLNPSHEEISLTNEVQEAPHLQELPSSITPITSSDSQWQLNSINLSFEYRKPDLDEPLFIATKKKGVPKTRLPRIEGAPVKAQLEVAHQFLMDIEDILKRSNKLSIESHPDSILVQDQLALMYYMLRLTECLSQLVETESFKEINQAFKSHIVDCAWMRRLRNDLRSHFLFIPMTSLYNTARALIKSSLSHNIKIWLDKKNKIKNLLPQVSELDIPPLCQVVDRQAFKFLLEHDRDFISSCLFKEMKKDLQTISQLVHVKSDFSLFSLLGEAEQTACKILISNLRKYLVIFKSYDQIKYFTPTNKEEASLKKCLTNLIHLGNIVGHEIGIDSDDYLDYADEIPISQLYEIAKLAKPISEFVQSVEETHFAHLKSTNSSLTFRELAHKQYQKYCLTSENVA